MNALITVPGSLRTVFIDTSIVVAFLRHDQAVRQHLTKVDIVTSTVVIGELYYGAYRAGQSSRELANIAALIVQSSIVICDLVTSEYYGRREQRYTGKERPFQKTTYGLLRARFNTDCRLQHVMLILIGCQALPLSVGSIVSDR